MTPVSSPRPIELIDAPSARAREERHTARADSFDAEHRQRRRTGQRHPVFDFLFDYYSIRPSHLHRWHPGVGARLVGQDHPRQLDWPFYRRFPDGSVGVDVAEFRRRRGKVIAQAATMLHATATNPARFDCFGLHEWAMVYRGVPRHDLPLRLGANATNAVVEDHQLRCTHFDAFRFFTPAARPLNACELSRSSQAACDQSGCLHATMDLVKWALKLTPAVPGELVLDAFGLAWDARILDMEASPYDCSSLGLGVVPIETAEGKATYVHRQRELSARGNDIRQLLLEIVFSCEDAKLLVNSQTS
ncbi:3-methyladenine DNA glycosylase [Corynebacterium uberis]|uniref:3-methyladenine DNA glycosylase n=1 Tax=Corynebacterium TaxID=1716 RepID=UPI001D0A8690|nr:MULTISPECIES: 3-methyladenine DNA glycosylase [Corynebacterium]MCZ9308696.1 3-methyladenine DNA glycosylase [Corynebacterium sp. c6VSa_13]UDL74335.1 3-methyladenine DNA glycosylase [Corynebacterium uberis]UDL76832.1 3-methyladenine DNA glycosylase [Corynebacterium uberis]UDL79045.1 3-methyladenine DNA glycosylase [Corynebacterium uberis]UDL79283.1 3-methyladenine DNA glycosylase [Corynebacterium uberis]